MGEHEHRWSSWETQTRYIQHGEELWCETWEERYCYICFEVEMRFYQKYRELDGTEKSTRYYS